MDFRSSAPQSKRRLKNFTCHESNVILILADRILRVLTGSGKGAPALNSLKQNSSQSMLSTRPEYQKFFQEYSKIETSKVVKHFKVLLVTLLLKQQFAKMHLRLLGILIKGFKKKLSTYLKVHLSVTLFSDDTDVIHY